MSSYVEALAAKAVPEAREKPDFGALVAATQRRVVRLAASVLGDAADAEEVAQEAYLRAYRRFASLRDPDRFQAWVCRIALRLALNRQRARRRQLVRDTTWFANSEPLANGARHATDRLFLEQLRTEIDRLPEKLRLVLLLCSLNGLTAAEAGSLLRVPVGTVRSRLHAARKRLLEAMTR